jgi:hypothetical protein
MVCEKTVILLVDWMSHTYPGVWLAGGGYLLPCDGRLLAGLLTELTIFLLAIVTQYPIY